MLDNCKDEAAVSIRLRRYLLAGLDISPARFLRADQLGRARIHGDIERE